MNVAAIMPCRGRAEQTIRNAKRLLATAGNVEWRLYAVGARGEAEWFGQLRQMGVETFCHDSDRLTYWQAMQWAIKRTDALLIASLANDLIPVGPWLQRAVEAYQQTFGDGDGLVGFNGDGHGVEHSCHFLISRSLLERYGGYPVWYDHSYGDNELVERATADDVYAKAPWSILAHDHPYFGAADDAVYAEGRAKAERDRKLFEQRRALGWPAVSR
jgi:hypothetical protein